MAYFLIESPRDSRLVEAGSAGDARVWAAQQGMADVRIVETGNPAPAAARLARAFQHLGLSESAARIAAEGRAGPPRDPIVIPSAAPAPASRSARESGGAQPIRIREVVGGPWSRS